MRVPHVLLKSWFFGAVLTIVFLLVTVFGLTAFEPLENGFYDFLLGLRGTEATGRVVLVDMDEKSAELLGPRPWPRTVMADMLERLTEAGARAVVLDVLYGEKHDEPGLLEVRNARRAIREKPGLLNNADIREIYAYLGAAEERLDGDGRLLRETARGKVVYPIALLPGKTEKTGPLPEFLLENSRTFPEPERDIRADLANLRNPLREGAPEEVRGVIERPFAALAERAAALGLRVDEAGGRWVPLLVRHRGRYLPSLALQAALGFAGGTFGDVQVQERDGVVKALRFGHYRVPTDGGYRMALEPARGLPRYSFSDVLEGSPQAGSLRDKLVFVGRSGDTSLEAAAQAAENIVRAEHIVRPPWAFGVECGVLLYFGVFVSFVFPRVRPRVGAAIVFLSLLPWLGVSSMLLVRQGIWLMAATPALLLGAGFVTAVFWRAFSPTSPRGDMDETVESHKMLGLSLQSQGMLDMALEKFMRCPVKDRSVRELLYNLALDFERKRMPKKAMRVYEHILTAGKFRDVRERLESLVNRASSELQAGLRGSDSTLVPAGEGGVAPTLGRYEVLKEIGRGAMGTVYLARDPRINREVALKTIALDHVDEGEAAEVKKRFFQEALAAGKLSHPHIMTIYDVGEEHDLAYMAMELLEGKDLSEHTARDNLLSPKEALKAASSVAQALEYAHQRGVIHRDVKPANIMLAGDGSVKVADFGIARVLESSGTLTGTVLGTPSYMSPEQVAGEKVEGPSDFFSLGVVLYELLSGEKPFQGDSVASIMYSISRGSYVPLRKVARKTPECAVRIVEKLLSKSLKKRYRSGETLARDLEACLQRLK
jgi:hypothetical protein